MRSSIVAFFGVVFVILMIGLVFTTADNSIPFARQITNEAGSTIDISGGQGAMLALLSAVVLGGIGTMAGTLYAILWFLNREVARVQVQEPEPILLSMSLEEERTIGSSLANNSFLIVVALGGLMTIIAIVAFVALG
jgi:hypothetical protein